MTFDKNLDATHGYAQIGYYRSYGDTVNSYFLEYADTTGGYTDINLGVDTSNWGTSSDTFTAYYDSGAKLFKLLLDGNLIFSVSLHWPANSNAWTNETHGQETQNSGDQVLGGYKHHTIFDHVQYLQNGAWHPVNAQNNRDDNNPYGGISTTQSQTFWVWDTRIA